MMTGFCNMRRSVASILLMVALSNARNQTIPNSISAVSGNTDCPVESLLSGLVSMEDQLNRMQRIVSTLNHLLIKENCTVDLASFGFDDSTKYGYVRTSGGSSEEFLVLDELGRQQRVLRGVALIELDPKKCTTGNRQNFDVSAYEDGRLMFLESLQYKPAGTVIVGVTGDTVERGDNVSFQNFAGSFFTSYNMNLRGLRFRDKFVFIIQKGYPNKTVFQMKPGGGESLKMKIVVRGSTSDDVTFNRV